MSGGVWWVGVSGRLDGWVDGWDLFFVLFCLASRRDGYLFWRGIHVVFYGTGVQGFDGLREHVWGIHIYTVTPLLWYQTKKDTFLGRLLKDTTLARLSSLQYQSAETNPPNAPRHPAHVLQPPHFPSASSASPHTCPKSRRQDQAQTTQA